MFPRLSGRGPIEAAGVRPSGMNPSRFPRLSGRGPIEAQYFLKEARKTYGGFRAFPGAVPLKLVDAATERRALGLFPRLSGRSPIEAFLS